MITFRVKCFWFIFYFESKLNHIILFGEKDIYLLVDKKNTYAFVILSDNELYNLLYKINEL